MSVARELWKRIESIHAVTYFAPESIGAAKDAGLRGFWMGYFGFRAAPMGQVNAGPVHAAFANFALSMIERALPDAWQYASPPQLVDARASAAGNALRRLSPTVAMLDDTKLAALNASLAAVIAHGDPLGRPLFAANVTVADRSDPVEQLWQLCTTLREHRGDGHVIALASHGVSGIEAHQLHAAAHSTPHAVLLDSRGFDADEWQAAADRLSASDLLAGSKLTPAGNELVQTIESLTDELAQAPIEAAGVDAATLIERLTPLAQDIVESGVLPFPNPMGLPELKS